jgi:ATP-dependent helicase/nuclease subunit A
VNFTDNQRRAITQSGNLLVLAGAGSGKTRTLVERSLHALLHPTKPIGIDEMLVVTYTIGAAAELRERIREGLTGAAAGPADAEREGWIEKQLAMMESAHISTLHSFCLHLVREHFHELHLDPALTVLAEEHARFLMEEALDAVLRPYFEESREGSESVHDLIQLYAGGEEKRIREFILRIHHYAQTLAHPDQWLGTQIRTYRQRDNADWEDLLLEGFGDWRQVWRADLENLPEEIRQRLRSSFALAKQPLRREAIAATLDEIARTYEEWPRGTLEHRNAVQRFYDDARFLQSIASSCADRDPLAEDWQWVRSQMETLLQLTSEFSRMYARLKREQAALDFHDLEQFALDLLLGPKRTGPTPLAEQWQRRFKLLLVDECQDINAAQDAILGALARTGADANLFLVGDIKQSIFRFRLAEPAIFQKYCATWQSNPGLGQVIPLPDNFRSAPPILDFVNEFFREIMRSSVGGVEYDANAELRAGEVDRAARPGPCVEMHLRIADASGESEDQSENATEAELEARLVAKRILELCRTSHQVWDSATKQWRPMAWRDVVILLRSPKGRTDIYAREFAAAQIPLEAERCGLFESIEISDVLSLLRILDNPLQDVPLLAVLRSPLVGLSLNELALIRASVRQGLFWRALESWHQSNRTAPTSTWHKVDIFLERFDRWRRSGRQSHLSERIEQMLAETHYLEWLPTRDRAGQRQANIRRFLGLAQQFDPLQRQGLRRFLRFVDTQRDAETDNDAAGFDQGDAVRLMSIHASKGLEFPVVVLADLGRNFNFRDLQQRIILDRRLGVCPQIKPPDAPFFYPSLPFWLSARREQRELAGEEMRLLYVAMTRARDTLLLVGTTGRKAVDQWVKDRPTTRRIGEAKEYLDWLGPWCTRQIGDPGWCARTRGETNLFRWQIHGEPEKRITAASKPRRATFTAPEEIAAALERIEWNYPWSASTHQSAKLSVSKLRQRAEEDDEATVQFRHPSFRPRAGRLSGAETGTVNHLFLQMLDLRRVGTIDELQRQADRMVSQELLRREDTLALEWKAILGFWQSELGRRIAAMPEAVHREMPFTARFSKADLDRAGIIKTDFSETEFVIVQGTVDLAVVLKDEIWIVDFKTNALRESELAGMLATYGPQLRLYASALSRIYARPVTERWLHFLSLRCTVTVPA